MGRGDRVSEMLDTGADLHYRDNLIEGRSVFQKERGGSVASQGVSVVLCAACHEFPVHAQGRCMRCYRRWKRSGHKYDGDMQHLHDTRSKRRPSIRKPLDRDAEPDAITFEQWCRGNGYDPAKRKYE